MILMCLASIDVHMSLEEERGIFRFIELCDFIKIKRRRNSEILGIRINKSSRVGMKREDLTLESITRLLDRDRFIVFVYSRQREDKTL